MELFGLSDLAEDLYGDYQDTLSAFVELYAASMDSLGAGGLQSTVRVTGTSSSSSSSTAGSSTSVERFQLQTSVTVTYDQDFQYLPLTDGVTATFLATELFSQEIGRTAFFLALQDTDALAFGALEAISKVVVLPEARAFHTAASMETASAAATSTAASSSAADTRSTYFWTSVHSLCPVMVVIAHALLY